MGVSTVAAKPVWSWARKDVKNTFIYFHVYRFKHALVKVMSCESQTGVWLMSFGTAQPPSLSFFGTQGSSWKSEADQVGPHHAPQFQDARFSCPKRRAFFVCLRQPLYWHRKKIQIHRAPNGASIRVLLLNRVFFLLFHKEKAQFIPSFLAPEKPGFWNFLMQRPSRVLLISSCAMRALFFLSLCAISCFFLCFFVCRIVFFFCDSSCTKSFFFFFLRFFVRHIVFFSAVLRAPNRALNGATVTGHGQDTRYASDM